MVCLDHKKIDWKAVKAEWDANPMFFDLQIHHNGVRLSFQPFLDKSKRCRLALYINGWSMGKWLNKEHEYYKYHNQKRLYPNKSMKSMWDAQERYNKTVRKKVYDVDRSPRYYPTPGFDNIAQIKRMVETLD